MHTDPIADLINQLKMGIKARKKQITIYGSKLKIGILTLLKLEGYIRDFKVQTTNQITTLQITLKYYEGLPSIHGIRQISKPGLRVYVPADQLPKVLNGLGVAIVSTNKGLMSAKKARQQQIGGEVLAYVW